MDERSVRRPAYPQGGHPPHAMNLSLIRRKAPSAFPRYGLWDCFPAFYGPTLYSKMRFPLAQVPTCNACK